MIRNVVPRFIFFNFLPKRTEYCVGVIFHDHRPEVFPQFGFQTLQYDP